MAQSAWSIVEMGLTKDLDHTVGDVKSVPRGKVRTKGVCAVTRTPVIRHSAARAKSQSSATRRNRYSAKTPGLMESKATTALHAIQQDSMATDQLQQSNIAQCAAGSPSCPLQRHISWDMTESAADTALSSTPSRKKHRGEKEDKLLVRKKKKKSKLHHGDRRIVNEDADWIPGIQARRPRRQRTHPSTINGSVRLDSGRRGGRLVSDLLTTKSALETQHIANFENERSQRCTPERSKTSMGRGSLNSSTPEKPTEDLHQISVRPDAVCTAWDSVRYNSQGVQTILDNDHSDGERKITALDEIASQTELEKLGNENESLRRQLTEAADWEMQVMRAYKTLAEKHHHSCGREEASRSDIMTDVPSPQQLSTCVTNRAGHDVLYPSESIVHETSAIDRRHSASHTTDNEKQYGVGMSFPNDVTSDAVVICTDPIQQENRSLGGCSLKEQSTRSKPTLVKSISSPLGSNMASSAFMPLSRKRAISVPTQHPSKADDSEIRVVSAHRVEVEEDMHSDVSSIYEQFEVSGDRHDMRFPWQRDVHVQCDRVQTREVSIQTDIDPCSQCQLRRLSNSSDQSELDSAGNVGVEMRKRSSVISSLRRSTSKAKPRLARQNFSLDLTEFSETHNGGPLVNGTAYPGSPPGPFRSRSSRISTLRPLSDSDISRSSVENFLGHSKIARRRKNADVAAAKSGINLNLTVDTTEQYALPCSPCESPIPQEFENSSNSESRPKVIITQHDDPCDDVQSQRSIGNCSQDSQTSESSSLRVPSPDFLQTKAVFKKDNKPNFSGSSDTEDNEPSSRPPTSRIHKRRGAVISQVPPNSSECGDDDGGGSGNSLVQDWRPCGNNSPPNRGDLLFPPSLGNEHRCSTMSSAASSTLASVAAVHLQDFIEASATACFDSNELDQDNNDSAETKKKLHALFKKKFGKDKDKSMIDDITTVFTNFKIRDQDDLEFATYKDKHWRDVILEVENNNTHSTLHSPSQEEVKRRDKVWELFRSECVYLIEHILVLKNVFQEPLRALQCEGYLMYIEPAKLFANIDELSQVSASFCRDLIRMLLARASRTEFCHTDAVVTAFAMFGNRVCPAYQRYCMNYSSALHYIDNLKKREDFVEFVKDTRCKRLQLADLMVAPIQHVTKYPLLLKDIRERTDDPIERTSLNTTLQAVEVALNELDGKVKWLGNFERLRELQQMITWPQVEEMDPKVSVPEFLKDTVAKMSKSNMLASTKRTLLHEGPLTLIDGTKSSEMYVFLFDDMLLISKLRRNNVKKKSLPDGMTISATPPVPRKKDGFSFIVYRPPIPLDRVSLVELDSKRAAASGLKHGFVLLQNSRYQQFVGAYTLAASDDNSKQIWLTHLKTAREKWIQMLRNDEGDDFANDDMRRDRKKTL